MNRDLVDGGGMMCMSVVSDVMEQIRVQCTMETAVQIADKTVMKEVII